MSLPDDKLTLALRRLRTTASLKLPIFDSFQENKFTIYYHNVQTLNTVKLKDIITDPLYNKIDLLILAEANVCNTKSFQFPLLKYLKVSLSQNNHQNVVCLTKQDMHVNKFCVKKLKYGVIHLALLQCRSVFILTGYVSPGIAKKDLTKAILELTQSLPENNDLILIGDFNWDNLQTIHQMYLQNLIPSYTLTSGLPLNVPTTIYNSQLDIIYTNIKSHNAQVYTSNFSDHYPIYVQVD